MNQNRLFKVALTLFLTTVFSVPGHAEVTAAKRVTPPAPAVLATTLKVAPIQVIAPGYAAKFLDSHFAQSQYDWKMANLYLDGILKDDPQNGDLLKRSMILAMGAGDLKLAATRAGTLAARPGGADGLALLIIAIDDFTKNNPPAARAALDRMPEGDVTDFVRPLLRSWADAASGKLNTTGLNATAVHSYSGGLVSLYLKNKPEAQKFAQHMIEGGTLTPYDAERAADLFAATGQPAQAIKIYQGIIAQEGASNSLQRKIDAVENGKDLTRLIPALQIATPKQGAAVAIFDLARILYQEQSDATARLFANMALALDPNMVEARLLLANALARNGRYDDALQFFTAITPDNPDYLDIEHYQAELMEEDGHTDQALKLLDKLFTEHKDIDAMIRTGDIYRNEEKYPDALKAYNKAAAAIGGKIPEPYWYLLYARGMTYERNNDWKDAEADLKAALAYRPDHPYILNYLAYGWAEQGIHLDESLKLVQHAATLRPSDGYIADSLGWIYYIMGRYSEAVPQLEKAVELLPYDSTLNDHLGDAYWQTGRKLEAHFQWQRALSNAATPAAKAALEAKLENGPPPRKPVKEAAAPADISAPVTK